MFFVSVAFFENFIFLSLLRNGGLHRCGVRTNLMLLLPVESMLEDIRMQLRLQEKSLTTQCQDFKRQDLRCQITERPRTATTPENRERILQQVTDNPEGGIRGMKAQLNLSYYAVQRTLKEKKWHDYKLTRVQNLHPRDNLNRLRFCRYILQRHRRDPNFLLNIVFTDESKFGNEGIWNNRNFHQWAPENPFLTHVAGFQNRFSLNLWAGMVGDRKVS